MVSQPRRQ